MSGTNFPTYPWSSGQKLGAKQLDDAFNNLYQLYNNLGNIIGIIQTQGVNGGPVEFNLNWGGGALTTTGEYVILLIAPYDFILRNVIYGVGDSGGTYTFSVRNGGVAVPGLTDLIASTQSYVSAVPSSGASVAQGAMLDILVSSVSGAPTDGVICIQGSRTGSIPNGNITIENAITQDNSSIITDDGFQLVFNVLN